MKKFTAGLKNVLSKSSDFAKTAKEKGQEFTNSAKDLVTMHTTQPTNDAMDARRTGSDELLSAATTQDGNISSNINLKGFMFEQEHARTFNESAAQQGSSLRAIVDPPKGESGEPDIRIIDTNTGETLKTYQAKTGQDEYVINSIDNPKYQDGQTDAFVINGESDIRILEKEIEELENDLNTIDQSNPGSIDSIHIRDSENPNSTEMDYGSTISLDGVESEVAYDFQMDEIASAPEAYAEELKMSADTEETMSGAVGGAAIAVAFQAIHGSIQILGKIYRGEDIPNDIAISALKDVMAAATSGAIRGSLIKIIEIILEKIMEDSASLPVVLLSITPIVYKTILKFLKDEITLEECVNEVGSKTLSRAMIITLGVYFPPLGISLLGVSVLTAIWKEFEIANQIKNNFPESERFFMLACEAERRKIALIGMSKEHFESAKKNTTKSISIAKEKANDTSQNIKDYCNSTAQDTVSKIQGITNYKTLKGASS